MSDFETRVMPVVSKLAKRWFKDEQQVQDAIGSCWFAYQQTPNALSITATSFANFAVLAVRRGRRLPGERTKQYGGDALDRTYWNGAGMQDVKDKRPGPDKLAEWKEEWESLLSKLNDQERRVMMLALEDFRTMDMAVQLGVSAARVSQIRRAIVAHTQD